MRKPRQPSYRHHRPSGQAVVTIDSRDHYLGRHGSPESREAYDRLIAEWLAAGRLVRDADPTVNALMLAYLTWAEGYYVKDGKTTGMVNTIRYASKPTSRLYGRTLAKSFGPSALKTVREEFIREGLARTEVNRRTRAIVRGFKWGVSEEMVPSSVLVALQAVPALRKGRTPAPEREPVGPVEDAHVEAVLPFLAPTVRAIVELQRYTGMRPGEALIIRTCDIERDPDGPGWWYTPAAHKTEHHGRKRRIYLGPRARATLEPWLKPDEPDAYLFSPRQALKESAAARRKGSGEPHGPGRTPKTARRIRPHFSTASYGAAITTAIKKANAAHGNGQPEIPHWHPHQIRHAVSGKINRALDIEAARTVLGHKHVQTTEHYTREDYRKAAEAMEKLG